MNQRIVERKIGDKWLLLNGIQDLKKGQSFRMWESDGETPVVYEEKTTFKASGEPYWSDTYDTWMIDIETKILH